MADKNEESYTLRDIFKGASKTRFAAIKYVVSILPTMRSSDFDEHVLIQSDDFNLVMHNCYTEIREEDREKYLVVIPEHSEFFVVNLDEINYYRVFE
jgi:tRNA uridine 5-carbamoylmethylation protein Kti12